MGSGKYGALTGAMTRMRLLENINRNLANAQTASYKKGMAVFEAQLDEARATRDGLPTNYALIGKEEIDFTPGQLNHTGVPTHLAINNQGFFRVQLENGDIAYARGGSFHRNRNGEMINDEGAKLLAAGDNPLVLNSDNFSVSSDGSVLIDGQLSGTIPLYDFADKSGMHRVKGGYFLATGNSVATQVENPDIAQGYLEGSNVNVMQETARMVYAQRVFEAAQKALLSFDEMDRKLSDLGNVQ